MKEVFIAPAATVVLDAFESDTGALIELTIEPCGCFGVYYRVGPFAHTVVHSDWDEAMTAFCAAIDIEMMYMEIRNMLQPRIGYVLIEYTF